MARNGTRRRKGDTAFLVALASGASVKQAAAKAGIGRRTAFRRLAEATVKKRVGEMRAEIIAQAAGRLARISTRAAAELGRLLGSPDARVRLSAAWRVLRLTMQLQATTELDDRLKALEAALGRNKQ
jgi:hypothetical protein